MPAAMAEYHDHVRAIVAKEYPTLATRPKDRSLWVEGVLQVVNDGICHESFLIAIDVPNARDVLPKAYEMGGRLPRDVDHHVNPDGSLCLGVPEQLWIDLKGDFELSGFLARPVRSFLIDASEKLRTGRWPHSERPHGGSGIREFYRDHIGTADPRRVLALLHLLQAAHIDDGAPCVCGGRKPLRRCHARQVRDLRGKSIPAVMIARSIALVEEGIQIDAAGGPEEYKRRMTAARDRMIEEAVRRTLYPER